MGRLSPAHAPRARTGNCSMEMNGKAERLRLLHERGRLGRGMRHGGVRYWIGHHRRLGLLIFDPHAQREVETGKVRLFSVAGRESRLFMLNMARTRSLWSSPDDHREEMRKAVIDYGRARERQRETHCYWCRRDINSVVFFLLYAMRLDQMRLRALRLPLPSPAGGRR